MKVKLTQIEEQVFNACKAAVGVEFEEIILIENIKVNMTRNVLRGYIGQLIKKGWLRIGSWDGTFRADDTFYSIA